MEKLSAREIEKECFELEKKRLDRKAAASQAGGGYKYGQVRKPDNLWKERVWEKEHYKRYADSF